VIAEALGQLPFPTAGRVGHEVLIRTDGAGGTHEVVEYLTNRALSYSLGFGLTTIMVEQLSLIPAQVWTPAYDAEETPREGAWVAELTGLLDLSAWPVGMRVIVRKERPHPGGATAVHRYRRAAADRVHHQHPGRAAGRSGTTPPPARPV